MRVHKYLAQTSTWLNRIFPDMYFKKFFRFVVINIFLSPVFQDGKDYKVQIIDGKIGPRLYFGWHEMLEFFPLLIIWALSEE